jgi:hypothetical protein
MMEDLGLDISNLDEFMTIEEIYEMKEALEEVEDEDVEIFEDIKDEEQIGLYNNHFGKDTPPQDESNMSEGLKLVNISSHTIYYKPESGSKSVTLGPGETFQGAFDGFAAPHIKENAVYKVVDGVSATVSESEIDINTNSSVKLMLGQFIKGGWKGEAWIKDLNRGYQTHYMGVDGPINVPTPVDKGWNNLYNSSKR